MENISKKLLITIIVVLLCINSINSQTVYKYRTVSTMMIEKDKNSNVVNATNWIPSSYVITSDWKSLVIYMRTEQKYTILNISDEKKDDEGTNWTTVKCLDTDNKRCDIRIANYSGESKTDSFNNKYTSTVYVDYASTTFMYRLNSEK